MLTRIDRIQAAVTDRQAAATAYGRLLGADVIEENRLGPLAARRTVLALGTGEVELLEPDGSGAVADFVARHGPGLFAAGVAVADIEAASAGFERAGLRGEREGRQIFLSPEALGIVGLRVVVTEDSDRNGGTGPVDFLYEVTHLTNDAASSARAIADRFGLRQEHFAPIESEQYGYSGILTLFAPDRLDRLETITPSDPGKTMGRFFAKRGPSLYMCFAESKDTAEIRGRLMTHVPRDWTGPTEGPDPDVLFVHPKALGGVMIGISRTGVAWTWSGRPERAQGADEQ